MARIVSLIAQSHRSASDTVSNGLTINTAPPTPAGSFRLERETRIELATNSLEGCDSTIELLPPAFFILHSVLVLNEQQLNRELRALRLTGHHLGDISVLGQKNRDG